MPVWHVYQLRSDTELLYVGQTRQLKIRLCAHRREKSWWPEVTDVRVEEFTSEDEARQREKELWAAERPKYNRACPFQTDEERRAYRRMRDRARGLRTATETVEAALRRHQAAREYMREYNRRPEVVESHRIRYLRLKGEAKQAGPTLF